MLLTVFLGPNTVDIEKVFAGDADTIFLIVAELFLSHPSLEGAVCPGCVDFDS